MEGLHIQVLGGAVHLVDLQPPGQVGGRAEQLLVEPVAEASDGLGQRQGRHDGGEGLAPVHALAPHHPQTDQDSRRHPARYAQAPFQMAKISAQPASWNLRQSVITW